MMRLRKLYHAYEGHNDKLEVLNPNNGHQAEFANVQNRFYALADEVENTLNVAHGMRVVIYLVTKLKSSIRDSQIRSRNVLNCPRHRCLRLMGSIKTDYALKTHFNAIGSQTDFDKLHYLKSTLIGEAAAKVRIFEIEEINYSNAWKISERA